MSIRMTQPPVAAWLPDPTERPPDATRPRERRSTVSGCRSRLCGAYGTHPWSATAYHAQALAGRGWFYGNRLYTPGWSAVHPWAWTPAGYAAADWAAAAWTTATWPSVGLWLGYANPGLRLQLRQFDRLQQRRSLLRRPGRRHGEQHYQEAANLAVSRPTADAAPDAQWLPLGVFGLMADGKKTPDMVFQLAVNKQGHDPRQLLRPGHADQSAGQRGGQQAIAASRL